jgi:cyanophycinase-like exopeptidase
MGIGVDENTSLLIKGRDARVIGPSQVLLFKKVSDDKLDVTVVAPGMTFIL